MALYGMQAVLSILFVLGSPPPEAAEVVLAFEEASVSASGVTPGGSVVWFGVAREPSEWASRVVRRAELAIDEDQDGRVDLPLPAPAVPKSVWLAVDLVSGRSALAAPPEGSLAVVPPDPGLLRAGPGEAPDAFAPTRHAAELLLVRPAVGAWRKSVSDGGPADDDGEVDGVLLASLGGLEPLGASPPAPVELAAGDLVILIDPDTLETSKVEIEPEGGP